MSRNIGGPRAKNRPRIPRKIKTLLPLSDRGQDIMATLLNSIAFGTHKDVGDVDALAEKLGTTPGRLRPMLRKLEAMGYLTIEGTVAERVLPTVAAIRWQNPRASVREAAAVLKRLR
jgi:hypothetical protein